MIDASGEEDHSSPTGKEGQERSKDGCTAPTPAGEAVCPVKKTDQERKLTDEEVVAHAVQFIFAGSETTTNTLAYTSYLLALNPDIQEKLQSKIDSFFDDKPVSITFSNYCYTLLK